jgi:hypothetical protein
MLQVDAGESRVPFQDRQRALRALPAPEPAAGSAAYEREHELALSRSRERPRQLRTLSGVAPAAERL